jgi:hypothetical protein
MPGFDGTGPQGQGPMTGGARGWCNPYGSPRIGYRPIRSFYPPAFGSWRPRWGLGRGFFAGGRGGRGWGRGRGRGRW